MSMSNKIPEAELPAALRQPSQDLVPGTKVSFLFALSLNPKLETPVAVP